MKKDAVMVRVTLWANRLVAACLFVLLFTLPAILEWYSQYRALLSLERTALTVAFYCCAAVVAVALWNIDGLLRAIGVQQVFTRENVRRIRVIRWCCAGTALICLPATFCYYPLVFMTLVMAFLSLVVTVVVRVMDAAVTIREENDLTI